MLRKNSREKRAIEKYQVSLSHPMQFSPQKPSNPGHTLGCGWEIQLILRKF